MSRTIDHPLRTQLSDTAEEGIAIDRVAHTPEGRIQLLERIFNPGSNDADYTRHLFAVAFLQGIDEYVESVGKNQTPQIALGTAQVAFDYVQQKHVQSDKKEDRVIGFFTLSMEGWLHQKRIQFLGEPGEPATPAAPGPAEITPRS